MMAKIVKGSGAKGVVDYILDKKKQATLIDCQGVLFNDNSTIAKSFIAQLLEAGFTTLNRRTYDTDKQGIYGEDGHS